MEQADSVGSPTLRRRLDIFGYDPVFDLPYLDPKGLGSRLQRNLKSLCTDDLGCPVLFYCGRCTQVTSSLFPSEVVLILTPTAVYKATKDGELKACLPIEDLEEVVLSDDYWCGLKASKHYDLLLKPVSPKESRDLTDALVRLHGATSAGQSNPLRVKRIKHKEKHIKTLLNVKKPKGYKAVMLQIPTKPESELRKVSEVRDRYRDSIVAAGGGAGAANGGGSGGAGGSESPPPQRAASASPLTLAPVTDAEKRRSFTDAKSKGSDSETSSENGRESTTSSVMSAANNTYGSLTLSGPRSPTSPTSGPFDDATSKQLYRFFQMLPQTGDCRVLGDTFARCVEGNPPPPPLTAPPGLSPAEYDDLFSRANVDGRAGLSFKQFRSLVKDLASRQQQHHHQQQQQQPQQQQPQQFGGSSFGLPSHVSPPDNRLVHGSSPNDGLRTSVGSSRHSHAYLSPCQANSFSSSFPSAAPARRASLSSPRGSFNTALLGSHATSSLSGSPMAYTDPAAAQPTSAFEAALLLKVEKLEVNLRESQTALHNMSMQSMPSPAATYAQVPSPGGPRSPLYSNRSSGSPAVRSKGSPTPVSPMLSRAPPRDILGTPADASSSSADGLFAGLCGVTDEVPADFPAIEMPHAPSRISAVVIDPSFTHQKVVEKVLKGRNVTVVATCITVADAAAVINDAHVLFVSTAVLCAPGTNKAFRQARGRQGRPLLVGVDPSLTASQKTEQDLLAQQSRPQIENFPYLDNLVTTLALPAFIDALKP